MWRRRQNSEEMSPECFGLVDSLRYIPTFPPSTGCHFESWLSKMPCLMSCSRADVLVEAGTDIIRGVPTIFVQTSCAPTASSGDSMASQSENRRIANGLDADFSIRLAPLFSSKNRKWESWHMKYYAPLLAPLRYVPILQECFTHRIVVTMTKTHR